MGSNPLLVKTYTAVGDIRPRTLVQFSGEGVAECKNVSVAQPIGVSDYRGAANGGQVDVIRAGIAEVQFSSPASGGVGTGTEVGAVNDGGAYLFDASTAPNIHRHSVGIIEGPPVTNVNTMVGKIGEVFIRPMTFRQAT